MEESKGDYNTQSPEKLNKPICHTFFTTLSIQCLILCQVETPLQNQTLRHETKLKSPWLLSLYLKTLLHIALITESLNWPYFLNISVIFLVFTKSKSLRSAKIITAWEWGEIKNKRQKSCYCGTFLRVCLSFTWWETCRMCEIHRGRTSLAGQMRNIVQIIVLKLFVLQTRKEKKNRFLILFYSFLKRETTNTVIIYFDSHSASHWGS